MAGLVVAFPHCEGTTFLSEDHEDKVGSIFVILLICILNAG
jgi:hypothetical protein